MTKSRCKRHQSTYWPNNILDLILTYYRTCQAISEANDKLIENGLAGVKVDNISKSTRRESIIIRQIFSHIMNINVSDYCGHIAKE